MRIVETLNFSMKTENDLKIVVVEDVLKNSDSLLEQIKSIPKHFLDRERPPAKSSYLTEEDVVKHDLYKHDDFLDFVSSTYNMELKTDSTMYGQGVAIMQKGDFLNKHYDQPYNPNINRHRAINMLVYLGHYEGGIFEWFDLKGNVIWDIKVKHNSALLFNYNKFSQHGVTKIKSGIRVSLRHFFYDSNELTEEEMHFLEKKYESIE
tara:strand:- start:1512 stop:2132 length:621 start_codon:yes stop_codon:yes gene_type:complete